jgi:spermidine synthase
MTTSDRTVAATDGQPVNRCCLPADSLFEEGTVRLNEPPDSDAESLLARLLAGAYDKPFVIDDGAVRRLYFDLAFVQSEMTIKRPYALNFAYTRKMMACLLFIPRPRHIVIVGLGGGSLIRFCHRHVARARITAVEIDPQVIAFGDLFELPRQDGRFALVQADAVEYFARTRDRADVVLLDGCDRNGIAPAFCDAGFYRNIRACLKERGVLVINLVGPAAACRSHLQVIRDVFAGPLIVQNVIEGGTKVAYAFNDPKFLPDWDGIERLARQLAKRHDLDFPALAGKLQRSGLTRATARRCNRRPV